MNGRLCQDEPRENNYKDWRQKERVQVRVQWLALQQAVLKLPILQQYLFSLLLYIYDIQNLTHTHKHTHIYIYIYIYIYGVHIGQSKMFTGFYLKNLKL
jgi:hypothetical protein